MIDYLDPKFLGRFTNDQGKILPRRITGVTALQQRRLSRAIKYARHLALLPFVAQDTR
jgi:small subunit ribosomal protein S18